MKKQKKKDQANGNGNSPNTQQEVFVLILLIAVQPTGNVWAWYRGKAKVLSIISVLVVISIWLEQWRTCVIILYVHIFERMWVCVPDTHKLVCVCVALKLGLKCHCCHGRAVIPNFANKQLQINFDVKESFNILKKFTGAARWILLLLKRDGLAFSSLCWNSN